MCGRNSRHNKRRNHRFQPYEDQYYINPDRSVETQLAPVISGVYCFGCGFNNPNNLEKEIQFCQYCGLKFLTCPISKAKFELQDDFGQCASCFTVFHLHHIKLWLKTDQFCPICKNKTKELLIGEVGINTIKSNIH
jgi:rRNA maturation endonuclease Nob1